ncbi:MAG: 4'-phosphopantetheinyl transferase superfamily protein [Betaproteobacteria bacterium]|jgi:KDO2-lipid IV(A) lauroyltransferase|nr:4'-phosphopantetheinyl transferase superfamily protein [Betaproteobacteria bacterium]
MLEAPASSARCGIDTVEIARIERLLRETPPEDLLKLFSADELRESGDGPGRAASLAARFAAKEACLKLFPRETALNIVTAADFAVARDAYGAPHVTCSPAAEAVLNRHRVKSIALSLSHDRTSASAVALADPARIEVPLAGKIIFHLLPIRRRVVLENLRRVFGETAPEDEIRRIAQAHYAHLWRLVGEFIAFSWLSPAERAARARVENPDTIIAAHARGKGVIVVTGHFGNFEVSTAAAIASFPQAQGKFYFVRRPFKPRWLDAVIVRRFRRAGFGVLPKSGSLDAILERLAAGDIVVFPFDQHAGPKDGVRVEFFDHSAGTFRSVALIAQASGATVLPGASWRGPDGKHVLRFEEPLELVERDDVGEEIRANTRLFNAALERMILRHPEQWWWVHRRWKEWPAKKSGTARRS